ncbi:MAG: hypothetical protein GX039_03965, partial [Clostridia bacterium]|nr:hypothetical protein [Clostridia bacterium]
VRLEEQHMVVQRLLQQKNSQIEEYKREITLLAAKLAEGQEQQQLLAAELARLEKKKTSLEEAIPRQEEEVAGQEKRLAKMQERQRILEARLRVLHQSRAAYEGFAEGVKFVLMASRQGELACAGVMGVVVEKLTVPAQLTRAIDVALGGAAQQILVKTAAEAETVINYLKARRGGRVTILPLEWLEPRHWPAWANWVLKESGVLGIAADLVSCEPAVRPAVRYLLGNVLVVEEIARALALGARLRPPLRLVTLEGETVQPRGAVSGGVSRQNTGFLQRSLEIEQLENELAGLKGNIKKGRQRLEALKLVLTNSRRQQQQLTEATIVCRSELQVLAQQHNRRSEQLNELREKITLLEQELAQNDTSSRELELAKDQRQELLAALRQQEEELNKQLGSVGKRLAARSQILTQLQQELAVNLARQEAINKTEAQLYIREQDLVRQQENWQRQFNELQKRQQEGELLAKKLAETEAKLRGDEEWLQGACRQLKSGCERLETERIARDEQQQELQRQQAELKGKQEKLAARRQQEEINMTRQEASLAALQTEITNHFGAGWQEELPRKGGHLEKKAEHLREVFKQKLELLGEVDPGAIILWERLQARYEDLQRQKQDLEDGRAALEQVISEMEKLMARQLKTTYEKVQMEFNAIFQELFEGGEASLQLNGNDILNAGLEIYVRPPGKKSQYLSLLSGGEKALTAIAFVFALLKVKPSAFCIFDEVDTALDDANVERFNRLLRQFAKRSQFIVISHRQGTMAAADVLYGVTMVEQGVSQVVSVRLEQLPA